MSDSIPQLWGSCPGLKVAPNRGATWAALLKIFFLRVLFIYLREREHELGEQQREREKYSLLSRQLDLGLDPRTLRS